MCRTIIIIIIIICVLVPYRVCVYCIHVRYNKRNFFFTCKHHHFPNLFQKYHYFNEMKKKEIYFYCMKVICLSIQNLINYSALFLAPKKILFQLSEVQEVLLKIIVKHNTFFACLFNWLRIILLLTVTIQPIPNERR